MDNENEFNYSKENSFRKNQKNSNYSGFTKNILVPFISGIVGASLVLGVCFNVPYIKSKLIGSSSSNTNSSLTSTSATSSYSSDLINLTEYSETSVGVASKVLPSIVGITVNYSVSMFGQSTSAEASGSGIIITEDGYILTNNHVISSESSSSYYSITEATEIIVYLYNDTTPYTATVIGTDSYTDLAVIKIEKDDLTPATLGNSDSVQVGEFAMAVGNPLGMASSITCGVVSAVDREVTDDEGNEYTAIQTDAAINSGNSGGALVNSQGEVIGINTLKLSGTGIEGIGFAIPISSTTDIAEQLIEYQTVKRPYIGISGIAIDSTTSSKYNFPKGVYVQSVEEASPAENAGIKQSDIITKIEGTEITTVSELNKVKYKYNIGDTITLTIVRNNEEMEIKVTLEETPVDTTAEDTNTAEEQNSYNTYSPGNSNSDIPSSFYDMFR